MSTPSLSPYASMANYKDDSLTPSHLTLTSTSSSQQDHQSINQSINQSVNQSINQSSVSHHSHLRNDYGRMLVRLIHQPENQHRVSKCLILINTIIAILSFITIILISTMTNTNQSINQSNNQSINQSMAYVNLILAGYVLTIAIRTIVMLILHTHCLFMPDMYINQHSQRHPATNMHTVQKGLHICVRIQSISVLIVAMIWIITQLDEMDSRLCLLALIWLSIDVIIVLGEIAVYSIVIQLVSWRVTSVIMPYVPISKRSLIDYQREAGHVNEQVNQRAGFDKKQLQVLKHAQHRYDPNITSINQECAICLLDFILDDHVNTLRCQHSFHSQCITLWLSKRGTCPLCVTRAEPINRSNKRSDDALSTALLQSNDVHIDVEVP